MDRQNFTGNRKMVHFSWPAGETLFAWFLEQILPYRLAEQDQRTSPLFQSAFLERKRLIDHGKSIYFAFQKKKQNQQFFAESLSITARIRRFFLPLSGMTPQPFAREEPNREEDTPFLAAVPVGDYRRFTSELDHLELVAAVMNPEAALDWAESLPAVDQVLDRSESHIDLILSTGQLGAGVKEVRLVLYTVFPEGLPTAVLYETCSADEWRYLVETAQKKGLSLQRNGLFAEERPIDLPSLDSVLEILGQKIVPPEQMAAGNAFSAEKVPDLITESDICGDMHLHTVYSDGSGSIEKMAETAIKNGLQYIALTDHTERCVAGKGMDAARIRQYWQRIDQMNRRLADSGQTFRILKGVEVDILADGTLDINDDLLALSDWIMVSCHFELGLPQEAMHQRIERALSNPYVCAMAHPTGRTIGSDFLPAIDPEFLIRCAAKYGKFLELNAQPRRLDLNEKLCRRAKESGVKIVISTDSHAPEQMRYLRYGIQTARAAGLTRSDVVNTLSLSQIRAEREKMLERRERELFQRG